MFLLHWAEINGVCNLNSEYSIQLLDGLENDIAVKALLTSRILFNFNGQATISQSQDVLQVFLLSVFSLSLLLLLCTANLWTHIHLSHVKPSRIINANNELSYSRTSEGDYILYGNHFITRMYVLSGHKLFIDKPNLMSPQRHLCWWCL